MELHYVDVTQLSGSRLDLLTSKCLSSLITGWAVALTCCISYSAKNGKMAYFDPQGAKTPEPILMKLSMVDYVPDPTTHDNFHGVAQCRISEFLFFFSFLIYVLQTEQQVKVRCAKKTSRRLCCVRNEGDLDLHTLVLTSRNHWLFFFRIFLLIVFCFSFSFFFFAFSSSRNAATIVHCT